MELKNKKQKDKIIVSKTQIANKQKKLRKVDFSKILDIDLDTLDRIAGGMVRLEHKYHNWGAYINHCLKLAKNEKEKMLIWYFIGFKAGAMAAQGTLIVLPTGPPGTNISVQSGKEDIAIQ